MVACSKSTPDVPLSHSRSRLYASRGEVLIHPLRSSQPPPMAVQRVLFLSPPPPPTTPSSSCAAAAPAMRRSSSTTGERCCCSTSTSSTRLWLRTDRSLNWARHHDVSSSAGTRSRLPARNCEQRRNLLVVRQVLHNHCFGVGLSASTLEAAASIDAKIDQASPRVEAPSGERAAYFSGSGTDHGSKGKSVSSIFTDVFPGNTLSTTNAQDACASYPDSISQSEDEEYPVSVGDSLPTGERSGSDASIIDYKLKWSMLLSTEALEDAQISRAGSVTDAHVLRRKGRLKEQDGLIEFLISMHSTHSPFQVMEKMERWVREHFEDPRRSTLRRLVPSVGRFYTPLPLVQALREYDEFSSLSRRKYVPPNFAELRHVLNIAQVHAVAEKLALVTFDADGTLYADGHHIEGDNKMIGHIIKLMQHGAHVAIVTAAGYPEDSARFETRFAGLLAAFEDLELPQAVTSLFHIMGGECNYLLEVNENYRLKFIPDKLWKPKDMLEWSETDVKKLLSDAECALKSAAARLHLPVDFIRKPRAVGVVPKEPTIYEVLEEMALTVQVQLVDAKLPFCAFNGGKDVFVDVGNKSIGLGALMNYLQKGPNETLHVGDRFTVSGNDSATRSKCPILWVANPEETAFYTRMLLYDIRLARLTPYIE